jgi:hypothetical protein
MRDYLFDAIKNLTNGAGFMIWANDYSTIQWVDFDGTPPTQSEIDAEIVRIKAEEEFLTAQRSVQKADLLQRLGITADEAALLLS